MQSVFSNVRIKIGVQDVECKVATFLLVVTVEPQPGAELGRVLGFPGGQLPQLQWSHGQ